MLAVVLCIINLTSAAAANLEGVICYENPFAKDTADSPVKCSQKCGRQSLCKSYTELLGTRKKIKCSLLKGSRRDRQRRLIPQVSSYYLEKVTQSMFVFNGKRQL